VSIKNYFGLALILIILVGMGLFGYSRFGASVGLDFTEPEVVRGYLGWEKKGFFEDPEVQQILTKKYDLKVEINKKGSIEMVREPAGDMDYLFPSNRIALEFYKNQNPDAKSQTIYFSPIVVFSWQSLIPDLEKAGLVSQADGIYTLDLDKLIQLIEENKKWEDIGSAQLKGRINISSTDPARSSSGNLFSALILNSLVGQNTVATEADLTPEIRQRMTSFFAKMGLLDSSSGDIFENF
jgi:hypothetical protein